MCVVGIIAGQTGQAKPASRIVSSPAIVGLPLSTPPRYEYASATALRCRATLSVLIWIIARGSVATSVSMIRYSGPHSPDQRHQFVVAQRVVQETQAEHDVKVHGSWANAW